LAFTTQEETLSECCPLKTKFVWNYLSELRHPPTVAEPRGFVAFGRTSVAPPVTVYKYQLSLTNPRDALPHGKRAANKDGRSLLKTCDRTKLTTLATVDVFTRATLTSAGISCRRCVVSVCLSVCLSVCISSMYQAYGHWTIAVKLYGL